MSIPQFIEDAKQDLSSPTVSGFPSKIGSYKSMISNLDELFDSDKNAIHKFKKAVKAMHNSAQELLNSEVTYAENMEKLGSIALSREAETGVGTAFLKLSVITKELCNMKKNLCGNFNNMVLFPLDSLLKGDIKSLGELKKPFEEAWKDYKAKGTKVEKEARKKTGEIVLYRIDPEKNDETEKERRICMYHMSEFLVKATEVKYKKGVELVQHLIEYYYAQLQYFHRGMELLENMRSYFEGLTGELQQIRTTQDEERKELMDLKSQLRTNLQIDKLEAQKIATYSLHGQQGDKVHGTEKKGMLHKRSEGVRKQWQRRYCVISKGQFTLAHNQSSNPTVTLNLLTCQVKPSPDRDARKYNFSLIAHQRTYLFQAEDEAEFESWISVLSNAREEALKIAFGDGEGSLEGGDGNSQMVHSLKELTQGIVEEIKKVPGNNMCVDCGSPDPTWFSTNLGILVCIECSGIHRDMGVHVSRIRSLTLDRLGTAELLLAKAVGNGGFNEIMEAELDQELKPTTTSTMEKRKEYIQAKYIQKKYVHKSGNPDHVLLQDLSNVISSRDILALLQLYVDGVDLTASLPDSKTRGTALHEAVEQEDLTSLHIIDFLVQNSNNLDVQNVNGDTALHLAARLGQTECAKLILRGGATCNITNKEGKTPLHIATTKGYEELVELLIEVTDGKLSRCDNVKIDWGINQADGIYENPLDLVDLKLELKDENSDLSNKLSPNSPAGIAVLPLRSASCKTPSTATPLAGLTSTPLGSRDRHSVAVPSGVQVLPLLSGERPILNKVSHNTSSGAPPPPPARKSVKQRTPPHIPLLDATSPVCTPSRALGEMQAHTPLTNAESAPLTSFGSKQPPPAATTPDKGGTLPPPTPPARTSSSLPRPERPAPPPPSAMRHSRNASDGNVVDSLKGILPGTALSQKASKTHQRTESDPSFMESNQSQDEPPPLPPPRGRPKLETVKSDPEGTSEDSTEGIPALPQKERSQESRLKFRRARALYDCSADHEDELSFKEGEIIIVRSEADPEWLFGEVEGEPKRRGVFPINFVHVLND